MQEDVWKVQNTTGHFLALIYPSNFFLKVRLVPLKSFQFMNFSEAMFYENYLTLDFHTNTVIAYSSK